MLAGVLVTVIVGGLAVAIFPGSLPLPGGPDGPLAAGTVAPGESPPIEPGPDLGGGWTTAPDPSLLIELPGGLHVASDQLLVTLDGGESAARSLAALVDGEVVGHVEAFGVWKIGFAPVLDVGAWQARYDAVAAVPGVTAVSSVGLEIPYGDCAAALGDKVYAGNGTASYDMIGVGGAWAAWYASGVPKHPVHIGVIDSPLTKDPKGRINWEFDNATWAGEPQTVAEPADKTEEPFESGFHHADMVMGILAGDLSDGGTAGVASVLGSNAILSHATMGEAPREGEATGWEAAPGVTYTDHEMLNIVEQVEAGATIINLSLGPEKPDASLAGYAGMYRTFFDTMAKQHPEVLFVIAAGNEAAELDGHNSSAGIAAPNVITVANVTTDGKLFDKSNRVAAGSDGEVTIAAPGHEAVWGMGVDKQPQKRYGGTSAAAPMVSGTAALIRSIDPSLSAAGVKKILVDSAAAKEGGAVLSADAAVLSAVNGVRDRQGKPRLTKADVAKATDTCVLKVNALISERHDDGTLTWTITSKLDAGTEPTAIALVVNGLRPSNWRQPVTRPDQVVTWTVRVPAAGVPITVTRLDNGFWRGFTLRESAAKPTAAPTARPTAKPTAKPKATARPTPAPPSGIDCSNPPPEGTIAYMKWSLGCGGAISP